MPFFALFVWPIMLLRWSLTQAFGGAAYILAAISCFPSYLCELWRDELSNYSNIPKYFSPLIRAIFWCVRSIDDLGDSIDGKLIDANLYFSDTLPTDFHDFTGDMMGDVTPKQWKDFIIFIFIISAIFYICTLLEEVPPTAQTSPASANEDESAESTYVASPARPHPQPSFEPMAFKNFRGDAEYFKRVGVFHPPIYNTSFRLSFPRRPLSTSVRSPTLEVEPLITSPMKESEGSQHPRLPHFQQNTTLSSTKTPHKKVEVAWPQADTLPTTSSAMTSNDVLTLLEDIPSTPQPLIPPSPFKIVSQKMKEHTKQLGNLLQAFIENVEDATSMRAGLASLDSFLLDAYNSMRASRSQLTSEEAFETGWTSDIQLFWAMVQPHGYALSIHHGDAMHSFLQDFVQFGRYLHLQLPDLNMTPPLISLPPPPAHPTFTLQQNPPIFHMEASNSVTHNTDLGNLSTPAPSVTFPTPVQALQPNFPTPAPLLQQGAKNFAFQPQSSTYGTPTSRQPVNERGGINRRTQLASGTQPAQNATSGLPARQETEKPVNKPVKKPAEPKKTLPVLVRTNGKNFSMAADRLSEWNLEEDELLTLTKENLGWTNDAQLWTYDPCTDLALNTDLPAHGKAAHARTVLDGVALKFKRAAVILRLQAHADTPKNHMASTPKLLGAMKDTLDKANKMFRECGKSSLHAREWNKALVFFHNECIFDDDVEDALQEHYGNDPWSALSLADDLAVMYFIAPKQEGSNDQEVKGQEMEDANA
ncbi:hypothetical protein DE146DRAFT_775440 [Phaeosphaeria sp. MPI-PUGE-AT-0046c]|nr:hypothetical protein DE146DRAFT_775440 [Phaeosphaeria sp. MPI-PUGE-AT-0046c]